MTTLRLGRDRHPIRVGISRSRRSLAHSPSRSLAADGAGAAEDAGNRVASRLDAPESGSLLRHSSDQERGPRIGEMAGHSERPRRARPGA